MFFFCIFKHKNKRSKKKTGKNRVKEKKLFQHTCFLPVLCGMHEECVCDKNMLKMYDLIYELH